MSTNYPAALDNTTDLVNNANDATLTESVHAAAHNNVADALIAIETELGANPSGTFATVAAWLASLDTGTIKVAPGATQIITPTGDTVGLVVKLGNALNIANMFEARLADDTVVAFVDRLGNISAQTFKINGAAPTGSGGVLVLSNSPTISSPTMTGTPTAPTPAAGDSSTKVATTAFVNASGVPIGAAMDWPYAAASIPSWSALGYGQPISRATYATLNGIASAAGYPHGAGDGSTTFNLPDYRGRIGVGKDDMGGTAASRITVAISGVNGATLGAVGGTEGVTLTTAQLPAHNHSMTGSPSITNAAHSHGLTGHRTVWGGDSSNVWGVPQFDVAGFNDFLVVGGSGGNVNTVKFRASDVGTDSATAGSTVGVGSLGTANTGSGSVHQNTQPTIIVNKIIRIQ